MRQCDALSILTFSIMGLLFGWSTEAGAFSYTDKLRRVVTIPVPVTRAVIFQTYELIPALGIWDQIVGVGRNAYDSELMRAVKPDIARAIPCAGTGTDVNVEALLKLKPDVVITWTFKPDAVKFMQERGLQVISVSPESLAELYEVMRLHGRLFGKEQRVETVIAHMEKLITLVRGNVSEIPPHTRRKVLWLSGRPTAVAGGIGVASDLMRLMGGINPASSLLQTSVDVSMEQIVAWSPDVIFIWGYAGYTAKSILESAQWSCIKAVTEGQVYKAPRWSNWSPGIAPVVLWMATKTYPDFFRNIDLESVFDDFYQEVYGIPYVQVDTIER